MEENGQRARIESHNCVGGKIIFPFLLHQTKDALHSNSTEPAQKRLQDFPRQRGAKRGLQGTTRGAETPDRSAGLRPRGATGPLQRGRACPAAKTKATFKKMLL